MLLVCMLTLWMALHLGCCKGASGSETETSSSNGQYFFRRRFRAKQVVTVHTRQGVCVVVPWQGFTLTAQDGVCVSRW